MGKCPSKACICSALSIWIFICVCILIHTSLLYLKPFIKVARLKNTMCRVEAYFYTIQYVCHCGKTCKSSYPCLTIQVSAENVTDSEGDVWVVPLYSDDVQQAHVQYADYDSREGCSLQVCHSERSTNREAVEAFRRSYGNKGSFIPCLYDPADHQSGALVKVVTPRTAVYHAVFWPSLAIVVGLVMCVVFCTRCRQIEDAKDVIRMAEAKALPQCPSNRPLRTTLKKEGTKFHKMKHKSLRSLWV